MHAQLPTNTSYEVGGCGAMEDQLSTSVSQPTPIFQQQCPTPLLAHYLPVVQYIVIAAIAASEQPRPTTSIDTPAHSRDSKLLSNASSTTAVRVAATFTAPRVWNVIEGCAPLARHSELE